MPTQSTADNDPPASADRLIRNTDHPMRHPWPEGMYVQGGARGVVLRRGGGSYRTAFVEVFGGTFLRGEGPDLASAEDVCWARYQAFVSCSRHPEHGPFEARGFRNGSGFCATCGTWMSGVLPKQLEGPDDEPSLLERALVGDDDALDTVVNAVAQARDTANGTSD